MVVQLWDASALAKRYSPEVGSDTVEALFAAVPSSQKVSTAVGYAEIYSVLLRKFNRTSIDRATFEAAKSALRADLINDSGFVLLAVDDAAFYSGIALMEKHNLNATDAALLSLFLSHAQSSAPGDDTTFLLSRQTSAWYGRQRRRAYAPSTRQRFPPSTCLLFSPPYKPPLRRGGKGQDNCDAPDGRMNVWPTQTSP